MSEVQNRAREVLQGEAEALLHLIDSIGPAYDQAVDLVLHCTGKVVVTGMGKAGHVGGKIAASLASTGTPAFFVHPGEGLHGDAGMVSRNDVVVALSNSGETSELLRFLAIVKRIGTPIIAITGGVQSSLSNLATATLNARVAAEADPLNLAPTTSALAELAVGDALTVCVMATRGFTAAQFAAFHPGGALGRQLHGA